MKEQTQPDPTWVKTINCTPYKIIFETDENDDEYDIYNKKGKRVGVLRNFKGFFQFFLTSKKQTYVIGI